MDAGERHDLASGKESRIRADELREGVRVVKGDDFRLTGHLRADCPAKVVQQHRDRFPGAVVVHVGTQVEVPRLIGEEYRRVGRSGLGQKVLKSRAKEVLEIQLLLQERAELAGHRHLTHLPGHVLVGRRQILAELVQMLGDLFTSHHELAADDLELCNAALALPVRPRNGQR